MREKSILSVRFSKKGESVCIIFFYLEFNLSEGNNLPVVLQKTLN